MKNLNYSQKLLQQRAEFPLRRDWLPTKFGGKTLKLRGHRITIGEKGYRYRIWIDGVEGKLWLTKEEDAMLQAFDRVQSLVSKSKTPAGQDLLL